METASYRIIDANFNRAREAGRVIEDFCRFFLNNQPLAARAKKIRHELSSIIAKIDSTALIAARDTIGDVGIGLTIDKQMQKKDLTDAAKAACRRLPEALRTLAETIAPQSPAIAEQIEKLRYESYNLEKDIFLFADPSARYKKVRLYVVISSSLPADVLSIAELCAAGGADCVQLRAKSIQDDELLALAAEFATLCRQAGALSIINDRLDIAIACGADGVHLGQNDIPIEQAYKLQNRPLIIGKSTHSIEQLQAACRQPLTYASLGPVFATPTKPSAPAVGLKYVTEGTKILADTGIGHAAIGGINLDNIEQVLRAGAQTIAVCRAATDAANPKEACRQLKEKIVSFKKPKKNVNFTKDCL